ncbi:MAG: NUDIX hydrolase [Ardenticatenaceae bacterium]
MPSPSVRSFSTLADLYAAFANQAVNPIVVSRDQRCSAVALIFHEQDDTLRLCVGRRAVYEGDPWSGQMAFPGGKAESEDQTFHDIAMREVFEESGLRLEDRHLLGSLKETKAFGSRTRPPLIVRPMIYVFEEEPGPFKLSDELAEAHWIPVTHLWDTNNWTTLVYRRNGQTYPGIRYGENIIWGFTLRVLVTFSEFVGDPLTILK